MLSVQGTSVFARVEPVLSARGGTILFLTSPLFPAAFSLRQVHKAFSPGESSFPFILASFSSSFQPSTTPPPETPGGTDCFPASETAPDAKLRTWWKQRNDTPRNLGEAHLEQSGWVLHAEPASEIYTRQPLLPNEALHLAIVHSFRLGEGEVRGLKSVKIGV